MSLTVNKESNKASRAVNKIAVKCSYVCVCVWETV
jgi:hypothetical protein